MFGIYGFSCETLRMSLRNGFSRSLRSLRMTILVTLLLIGGCCSPGTTNFTTSKSDTVYVPKIIRDSTHLLFNPLTISLDSAKWWKQSPTLEIHDTTLIEGDTKYIVKYKRVQTDSGISRIEMGLSHELKDSNIVVTKTNNTAVYERYQRPWYEWFAVTGAILICLAIGFGIGRIKA